MTKLLTVEEELADARARLAASDRIVERLTAELRATRERLQLSEDHRHNLAARITEMETHATD